MLSPALTAQDTRCPDEIETTGKYVNYSYGFTIVIPKGLKGQWNSARCGSDKKYGCVCMSDHGRIIPLATENSDSDHSIEAFAGFSDDDATVQNGVERRLEWIRERSRRGSFQVLKKMNITIARMKAKRVLVRYFDTESKRMMIEDFVEMIRAGRVEYSLYLRGPSDRYEADKTVFEGVLHSFTLRRCGNC